LDPSLLGFSVFGRLEGVRFDAAFAAFAFRAELFFLGAM
jgi:hypothetical protein